MYLMSDKKLCDPRNFSVHHFERAVHIEKITLI